jgi:hypothetical protein
VQEELLDKHPDANVRVYAIWFSMFGTETRDDWPADVLTDSRVTHWWDEGKTVGRWYMPRIEEMRETMSPQSAGFAGNVLWDAYLVYGPDARWDAAPTGLRRWGRTILKTQDGLREAFADVLKSDTRSR